MNKILAISDLYMLAILKNKVTYYLLTFVFILSLIGGLTPVLLSKQSEVSLTPYFISSDKGLNNYLNSLGIVRATDKINEEINTDVIIRKSVIYSFENNTVTRIGIKEDDIYKKQTDREVILTAIQNYYLSSSNKISFMRKFIPEEQPEKTYVIKSASLKYISAMMFYFIFLVMSSTTSSTMLSEKINKTKNVILSSIKPSHHFIAVILCAIMPILALATFVIVLIAIGTPIGKAIYFLNKGYTDDVQDIGTTTLFEGVSSAAINDFLFACFFDITLIILVIMILLSTFTIFASFVKTQEEGRAFSLIGTFIVILMFVLAINIDDKLNILAYFPLTSYIYAPALIIESGNYLPSIVNVFSLSIFLYIILKYGMKYYRLGLMDDPYVPKFVEVIKNLFEKRKKSAH